MAFDSTLLNQANSYGFQLPQWVVDQVNDPNNPNSQAIQDRYSGQMQEMVDAQQRRQSMFPGQQVVSNGGGAAVNAQLHPEAQFFNPATMQQSAAGPTKSFGQLPAQPAQSAAFTTGQTAPIPVGQPAQQTNPYMSGAPQYNAPQTPTNPYLSQIANGMTTNLTNNLQRKILPGIGRGAVATGGYGGSRQGIAEGLAIGDTNTALANSLASLYGGAYNQDQSNALSRYGMDQGFYTAQRGQDLQQNNQGFNQYLTGLNTQLGMGQQLANVGQQEFNAPVSALQSYANLLNPFTGLNTSNTTPGGGGGAMGAIGGALTGAQLWAQIQKMLGG